jgi:hypothetical protein
VIAAPVGVQPLTVGQPDLTAVGGCAVGHREPEPVKAGDEGGTGGVDLVVAGEGPVGQPLDERAQDPPPRAAPGRRGLSRREPRSSEHSPQLHERSVGVRLDRGDRHGPLPTLGKQRQRSGDPPAGAVEVQDRVARAPEEVDPGGGDRSLGAAERGTTGIPRRALGIPPRPVGVEPTGTVDREYDRSGAIDVGPEVGVGPTPRQRLWRPTESLAIPPDGVRGHRFVAGLHPAGGEPPGGRVEPDGHERARACGKREAGKNWIGVFARRACGLHETALGCIGNRFQPHDGLTATAGGIDDERSTRRSRSSEDERHGRAGQSGGRM